MSRQHRLTSSDPLLTILQNMPSDQAARLERVLLGAMLSAAIRIRPGDRSIAAAALSYMTNKRRSTSAIGYERAVAVLFNSLLLPDDQYVDALMLAQLEQGLVLPFIYTTADLALVPPAQMPAHRHLRVLVGAFRRLRSLLVERFEPLVDRTAGGMVWARGQKGMIVDPDDARQDHRMATIRAIDKFDPAKGTLTSYIGLWMKNVANGPHAIAVGEAFGVTRTERARIQSGQSHLRNLGVPLDKVTEQSLPATPEAPEAIEDDTGIDRLRVLVELLRGTEEFESVRAALAVALVPYELSDDDRKALAATRADSAEAGKDPSDTTND